MRKLEAQHACGFVNIVAVHQEVLALFNYKGMDVADACLAQA